MFLVLLRVVILFWHGIGHQFVVYASIETDCRTVGDLSDLGGEGGEEGRCYFSVDGDGDVVVEFSIFDLLGDEGVAWFGGGVGQDV